MHQPHHSKQDSTWRHTIPQVCRLSGRQYVAMSVWCVWRLVRDLLALALLVVVQCWQAPAVLDGLISVTPHCFCCCVQILTKIGVLNVPEWYDAGKVSTEQTGIPLSELQTASGLLEQPDLHQLCGLQLVGISRWQYSWLIHRQQTAFLLSSLEWSALASTTLWQYCGTTAVSLLTFWYPGTPISNDVCWFSAVSMMQTPCLLSSCSCTALWSPRGGRTSASPAARLSQAASWALRVHSRAQRTATQAVHLTHWAWPGAETCGCLRSARPSGVVIF